MGGSSAQLHRSDPGWRDALCGLIGATVQQIAVLDGASIDVELVGGRRLRVPLGDDARVGPEAAHFLPDGWPDARMWVY